MPQVKELKRNSSQKYFSYKRRFGDRKDGWRVRSEDPFFGIIPHLMKTRLDSMVYFEEKIDIEPLEQFIRTQRKDSQMKDLSVMMVVVAACIRVFSQYPKINRFVIGRKVFARNYLSTSMVVKKEMRTESAENTICPRFNPDAKLEDIWRVLKEEVEECKGEEAAGATADFARVVNKMPNFVIHSLVSIVKALDYFGFLPMSLVKILPFHTSLFITDIGSVGIGSVYHHLYEFGTCSVFLSIGKKEKYLAMETDGSIAEKKSINYRFVIDERIADGYYYAMVIKAFRRIMKKPESLLEKPENVVEDNLK